MNFLQLKSIQDLKKFQSVAKKIHKTDFHLITLNAQRLSHTLMKTENTEEAMPLLLKRLLDQWSTLLLKLSMQSLISKSLTSMIFLRLTACG